MKIGFVKSLIIGSLAFLITGLPAQAAENIVLKYSILRESISVPELSHLAKTGEASPSLKSYLKLANKDPKSLQNILNQNIKVDGVMFSKVINSFVGNIILDQISEVIHTPSKRASRESLRGALVQSAIDDNNIQVIEVLENYPTSEIYVQGDRLVEVYTQIKGVIDLIPPIAL